MHKEAGATAERGTEVRGTETVLVASWLPLKLLHKRRRSFCLKSSRLDFGHLPKALSSPHMPFPFPPRRGRTKQQHQGEGKREGAPARMSHGLLLTMAWPAHCSFWVETTPRLSGQPNKARMGSRGSSSIFRNLMPGDHLSHYNFTGQRGKEERSDGGQENNTFCARAGVTPGLGGERGWETSGQ